jgi:excisionase family DNA binding protein
MRQPITVTAADVHAAQQLAEVLKRLQALNGGGATMVMADGQTIEVAPFLLGALQQLVALLAQGDDVALIPIHRDVSLTEAALLLNVSQSFLLRLLETGEMASQGTGDDRRIPLREVVGYKAQRHVQNRVDLATALRVVQEAGAYD